MLIFVLEACVDAWLSNDKTTEFQSTLYRGAHRICRRPPCSLLFVCENDELLAGLYLNTGGCKFSQIEASKLNYKHQTIGHRPLLPWEAPTQLEPE